MSHLTSIGIGHDSGSGSISSDVSLDQRVLEVLRDLVETHSSSRAVAESMGQAHNYVARILRGETKLRLDVLGRILETLNLSSDYFFQLVGSPHDTLDVGRLLAFFPIDGTVDDPWLDRVAPALDGALMCDVGPEPSYRSRAAEIDACELLRYSDRNAAQTQLESIVDGLLAELDTEGRSIGALGDLAVAIATWATIQRFHGKHALCARAFQYAVAAAHRSGESRPRAVAYQKAAYLMRDLTQGRTGLLLLDQASDAYLRCGDLVGCAKVFVDRAVLFVHLAQFESAVGSYETALTLLPDHEVRQRVSAFSGLAHCHEQAGDLPKALEFNEKACAIHDGDEDLALAYLVWNRANLAAALDVGGAAASFREAMQLLDRFAEPIDVAMCAMDLASLLVRRGASNELVALADELLAWLPALRGNRHADAIMVELVRCVKWGQVTQRFLIDSRRRLRHSDG